MKPSRDRRPTYSAKIEDLENSPRRTTALQGRKASLVVSVFNLLSTIVGSGVLSLPWVVRGIGVWGFVVAMCVMGLLGDLSVGMLVEAAELKGKYTWMEVATDRFGEETARYVCLLVISQCFGSVTSYLVIVKDIFTSFFPGYGRLLTFLLTTLFMYPVLRSKTILHLGMFSAFASFSIFSFIFLIAVKFISYGTNPQAALAEPDPAPVGWEGVAGMLQYIPIVCFSFTCHPAVLDVLKELKESDDLGRTKRVRGRMHTASSTAVAISTILYVIAGVAGYGRYKSGCFPNLLTSVGVFEADAVTTALQVAVLASISIHVPLVAYPCRNLLASLTPSTNDELRLLLLIFLPLALALTLPAITTVFSITGLIASTSLVFILPPLLCMPSEEQGDEEQQPLLLKDEEAAEETRKYTTKPKRMLLLGSGCVFIMLSLAGWVW